MQPGDESIGEYMIAHACRLSSRKSTLQVNHRMSVGDFVVADIGCRLPNSKIKIRASGFKFQEQTNKHCRSNSGSNFLLREKVILFVLLA